MSETFEMSVLGDMFVVCRYDASAPVPVSIFQTAGFVAVTRTDDELSVICREQHEPGEVALPRWRALKVRGPFPFDTIGVLSSLSRALADARVSLLAVSTHDTDYLFVQVRDFPRAVRALRSAGHVVHVS